MLWTLVITAMQVICSCLTLAFLCRSWGRLRRRRFLNNYRSSKQGAKDLVMLHPDLGLGGAERLVVDAGVGLIAQGNTVRMVTNYHNPQRAFTETVDGRLPVTVAGAWIPRHINGRGHVLLASARMCAAAVWLSLFARPCHCYIVDQVAAVMPVLRFLSGAPVVFYCHFPDQLCDPNRAAIGGRKAPKSLLARVGSVPRLAYRTLFDAIEGWTMRAATRIACNSKFSRSVTVDTFPFLARSIDPVRDVLYPPINIEETIAAPKLDKDEKAAALAKDLAGRRVVLSINRYERKKDLALAVGGFAQLRKQNTAAAADKQLLLVMAGGYDPRLRENVEYHEELVALAKAEGIPNDSIRFLRSFSDNEKKVLLSVAEIVLYTPSGEHFGIVPVEAMAHGKPVVAVASGGPLESVSESREVGLLCKADRSAFAGAMETLLYKGDGTLSADKLRGKMASAAKERCRRLFSLGTFAERLNVMVQDAFKSSP